ncbi:MAG: hypothetical protein KGL51_01800 [Betaproteobacteria bacterium]|nr:hypothetical protein [Betaproteobacteria bacterium]MDE2122826.1 hypothetical protein [Betaproteobacteria bacterium]MDE2186493.1 hypothetical protein [Betaproteobacteria bacterium]MDE2323394.1 hypothetical protein [Betaproteobacteria bacterium]
MKKILHLIFGDARNVASVLLAVALAWIVAPWMPSASGWVLVAALFAAAFWQAA